MGGRRHLRLALAALAAALACPLPANAAWRPEPATYGVGIQRDVPVRMSDGVVLRVDLFYPTEPGTSRVARGPFPVILTQTPYSKFATESNSIASALGAGYSQFLVQRGYIQAVADIRGTGESGGAFCFFCAREAKDGAELVRWAARLPHSDRRVGTLGASYLGIVQLREAGLLGRHSPLKAMFPLITANDVYRDIAFDGGIPDIEFDPFVAAVYELSADLGPLAAVAEDPGKLRPILVPLIQHQASVNSFGLKLFTNVGAGGAEAYEGSFWREKNPVANLQRIARAGIPTYLVGGLWDLFQRGEPLNYAGLQNAADGRSVWAPMSHRQRVSGRYQLTIGPWYHVTAGRGVALDLIELDWFDRWLKGERTGIDRTTTPIHVYEIGANRWVRASRYPYNQARPVTYYLGPGGSLRRSAPTASRGSDRLLFTGFSSPCSRSTEQWSGGLFALLIGGLGPCEETDNTTQSGPGVRTYTTVPFTRASTLAGPLAARIFLSSTRPDTELVATVDDVAPDGSSQPLTSGALLGSLRALDPKRTWMAPGGRSIMPYHPYTHASAAPIPVGKVVAEDIEIFPTFARIAAGHRLRLTLATSDTPHLEPIPPQLANLIGGVYEVRRSTSAASYLEVEQAQPSAFVACQPDHACALTDGRSF
jgi:putative CocE/NonD family hydrolase